MRPHMAPLRPEVRRTLTFTWVQNSLYYLTKIPRTFFYQLLYKGKQRKEGIWEPLFSPGGWGGVLCCEVPCRSDWGQLQRWASSQPGPASRALLRCAAQSVVSEEHTTDIREWCTVASMSLWELAPCLCECALMDLTHIRKSKLLWLFKGIVWMF